MIRGIEHFGLAAKEPAVLVKWYEDHLGFRTIRTVGVGTYFLQGPCGIVIEIYPAKNEGSREYDNYTGGWRHLAIVVDDFAQDLKGLLDSGVEQAQEPVINDQIKLVLMKDCEGNLFHLIQRKTPL